MDQTCVQHTACPWTAEPCLRVWYPRVLGSSPHEPSSGLQLLTSHPCTVAARRLGAERGLCDFLPLSGSQAG